MAIINVHTRETLGKPAPEMQGTMIIDVISPDGTLRTRDIMQNAVISARIEHGCRIQDTKFPKDITCYNGETLRIEGPTVILE